MRKNYKRRIAVDNRKKITTGYKGLSKNGKEIPKKADHFVLCNPETGESFFPELIEFYGDKPKEMFVMFPSDEIPEFFSDDYNLWTLTNNIRRKCDGESCLHSIDEEIEVNGKKHKYEAGSVSECICETLGLRNSDNPDIKKLACGVDMYLKAYVLNPENSKVISPTCYLFNSGSVNTADNIRSQLERFKRLEGIPFKLFVKEIKRGDKTFTIWDIIPHLTPQQLIEYQYSNVALTDGQNLKLLGNGESIHTEAKTEYKPEVKTTENKPKAQKQVKAKTEKVTDATFTDVSDRDWTINSFEISLATGELEGIDAVKDAVSNILNKAEDLSELQMMGTLILRIKELTEAMKEEIVKLGKEVKQAKGW